MRYYTHITVSVTAVHLAGDMVPLTADLTEPAILSGLVIGSVLPDIDETRSWIGRRVPFLSSIIKALFGHRGLLHSGLVLGLMVTGLVYTTSRLIEAVMLGVTLHIMADFFSAGGIPLFYPLSRSRSQISLYRTGGWRENTIFAACFIYWFAVLYH